MLTLDDPASYVQLYLVGALLGAIGGLTYELLQTVRGRTGTIEIPGGLDTSGEPPRGSLAARYFDLGFIANLIIGAVAALASLWLFPPEETVTVQNNVATTTLSYNIVKMVGLFLIVGSAGGAFLSAFQARALALVTQEQGEATKAASKQALDEIKSQVSEKVTDESTRNDLMSSINAAKSVVEAAGDSGVGASQRPS